MNSYFSHLKTTWLFLGLLVLCFEYSNSCFKSIPKIKTPSSHRITGQRKRPVSDKDLLLDVNGRPSSKTDAELWIAKSIFRTESFLITQQEGFVEGDLFNWDPRHAFNVTKWTDGVIFYEFAHSFPLGKARDAFTAATDHISGHTCIAFRPREEEPDYVSIVQDGRGCFSEVGRKGGKQILSLFSNCISQGTIVHELLHALGLLHEHTRMDRDDFVRVNWENVDPDMKRQFLKSGQVDLHHFNEPYDYTSIMHYPRKAFSTNGMDTMSSKKAGVVEFGNDVGLSKHDAKKLNAMYCPGNFTGEPFLGYEKESENETETVDNSSSSIAHDGFKDIMLVVMLCIVAPLSFVYCFWKGPPKRLYVRLRLKSSGGPFQV